MIRIGNIQSNLGDGVYSMIHDSCKFDSHTEFVVNTVKAFNYRHYGEMVICPWCKTEINIQVIFDNDKRERALRGANNTGEEQR